MGTMIASGVLVKDTLTGDLSTIIVVAHRSEDERYFRSTLIDLTVNDGTIAINVDLWYKASAIIALCTPQNI